MQSTRSAPGIHRTWRFARRLLAWALPAGVLAVMPKCPACLAAYAALWTGVGLSLPLAAGLRTALLAACLGALAFLAARLMLRMGRERFRRTAIVTAPDCPLCTRRFVVDKENLRSGVPPE